MYEFNIFYPKLNNFGYIKAVANVKDKHDRSTPSNYHWKILKCRMIIFSASTILACPDKTDERQVHIVFNQIGRDYDCLLSLFTRFSLQQHGYRLPEKECPYYTIQFWRGEPLTYPEICLTRNFPIITPKATGVSLASSFFECLKSKMPHVEKCVVSQSKLVEHVTQDNSKNLQDTQVVSLCTPTQGQRNIF